MTRMYADPFHHFELSDDGTKFKCAHCPAEYPRVPNDGRYVPQGEAIYQLHQDKHPDHKSTSVLQDKCPGKASRPAA